MITLLTLLALTFVQLTENEILLQLVDGQNAVSAGLEQAVSNIPVTFTDESGQTLATCLSNEDGMCLLSDIPSADVPFIRGQLIVGSYGRRSVTWLGGQLQLWLDISQLGYAHPPHSGERGEGGVATIIYQAAPTQTAVSPRLTETETPPQAPSFNLIPTLIGLLLSLLFVALIIRQGGLRR